MLKGDKLARYADSVSITNAAPRDADFFWCTLTPREAHSGWRMFPLGVRAKYRRMGDKRRKLRAFVRTLSAMAAAERAAAGYCPVRMALVPTEIPGVRAYHTVPVSLTRP